MKRFSYGLLLATILFGFSCTNDPTGAGADDTPPQPQNHRVSVESALAELQSALEGIDAETRAGTPRKVGNITAVKASDVIPATRSGETPEVEDLVYIANFGNDEGYAILAADDRLAPVIAITDQGSLTETEFVKAAKGDFNEQEVPFILSQVAAYSARLGTGGGIGGGGWIPPTKDIDYEKRPIPTFTRNGPWQTISQVRPLVHAKWDQKNPYNAYRPSYYAGCVPVAMGQLIATEFYKYRNTGRTFPKVNGQTIDWQTIFTVINQNITSHKKCFEEDEKPTRESLAVAWFLRNLGAMLHTKYGLIALGEGSGVEMDIYAEPVMKSLGFKRASQNGYTESHVCTMLQNFGNPVLVRGIDRFSGDGHAWLFDGFMKQRSRVEECTVYGSVVRSWIEYRTLFHCNFGYRGKCDGYYYGRIFDLTRGPKETDQTVGDDGTKRMRLDFSNVHYVISYANW